MCNFLVFLIWLAFLEVMPISLDPLAWPKFSENVLGITLIYKTSAPLNIWMIIFCHSSAHYIYILTNILPASSGLFLTSSRNVSESFTIEMTMDRWSENCWIVIDLWSKCWLVYAVVSVFKRYCSWICGVEIKCGLSKPLIILLLFLM